MKKVVIIGGGFAGLSAASFLKKHKKKAQVILIDRRKQFNFLPLLPDILSERISAEFLCADFDVLSKKLNFEFINDQVKNIAIKKKQISCSLSNIEYDYLIVATGSKTNFYGNSNISENSFVLDEVDSGKEILNIILDGGKDNFIIGGGGYTGIEMATNINRYFKKKGINKEIIIIEKSDKLLSNLPQEHRQYVLDNLNDLKIKVMLNSEIDICKEGLVVLKSKQEFKNSCLIWAAGVKAQGFIKESGIDCLQQGRIKADESLQFAKDCFCCGDTAFFIYKNRPLRMSVQFAVSQGSLAAENIINSINNKKLKKYHPLDLGYIIPMANNKACGNALGFKIKGIAAVCLHYFMCIFRTYFIKNKVGILGDLLLKNINKKGR